MAKRTDGIVWKPDGTRFYITVAELSVMREYSVSTPWDPATRTWENTFSVSGEDSTPSGIAVSDDGLRFFMLGVANSTLHEYLTSVAWETASASATGSFHEFTIPNIATAGLAMIGGV